MMRNGRWSFIFGWLLFGLVGCGADSPGDSVKPASLAKGPGQTVETVTKVTNAPLPHTLPPRPAPRAAHQDDWFEDRTPTSGIRFAYRDGNQAGFYTLLETVGGGVAMIDYDQDGDLDLFFTGGGKIAGPPLAVSGLPCALYRNDGDWKFTDVSKDVGVGNEGFYSHGSAVADYNRDGYPDLFVTGYDGCRLYRNQGGQRFVDVTKESGIRGDRWNTGAAWGDIDRDGWLDLYVTTYCKWTTADNPECTQPGVDGGRVREPCAPSRFPGDADYLWRNRGDGSFEDVAQASGISEIHRGLGVVMTDLDQDGWIDIFVANDTDENDLYYGGPNGQFTSQSMLAGVAFSAAGEVEGSMGIDFGDVDGDGEADLFYTNFIGQDNTLVRKIAPRAFANAADQFGVIGASRLWVGWTTGLADFDSDGWLDLYVANGNVFYATPNSPYFQPQQLFQNVKGKRFEEVSRAAGPYFSRPHAARGGAIGDLDNDGGLDLVIVHQNDPVVLLRNRHPANNWISLRLLGATSETDAIGAKVTSKLGDRALTRFVRSGAGYLSQFDPRVLLPREDDAPASVTVAWPSGRRETFGDLAGKQTSILREGDGKEVASTTREE